MKYLQEYILELNDDQSRAKLAASILNDFSGMWTTEMELGASLALDYIAQKLNLLLQEQQPTEAPQPQLHIPNVSGSLPLVQSVLKSRIAHFESLVGHQHSADQLRDALSSIEGLVPPELWETHSGNDR